MLLHSILSVLLSQQGTSTSFIQHFLLSCKRKPVSWTENTKILSDIPELLQAYFKGQLKLWHVIYVWKRHMALPHETKTCPETTEVFSNALKAGLKHTWIFFGNYLSIYKLLLSTLKSQFFKLLPVFSVTNLYFSESIKVVIASWFVIFKLKFIP